MNERESQKDEREPGHFSALLQERIRRINERRARWNGETRRETAEVNSRDLLITWIRVAVTAILLICAHTLFEAGTIRILFCVAAFLVVGYDRIFLGWSEAMEGRVFNRPMIVTFCGILAFVLGRATDAVLVMCFLLISDVLTGRMEQSLRENALSKLSVAPDHMRLLLGGLEHRIPADRIQVGDTLLLGPGNMTCVDCVVTDGTGTADLQYVTGSSDLLSIAPGSRLPGGAWIREGNITVTVEKTAAESFGQRRRRYLEAVGGEVTQESHRFRTVLFYYGPVVLLTAIFIGLIVPWIFVQPIVDFMPRALALLLLSSTYLFKASRPLSVFAGLCGCAGKGGAVRSGKDLRELASVTTVAADEQFAMSTGHYHIVDAQSLDGMERQHVLAYGASASSVSENPLLRSVFEEIGASSEYQIVGRAEIPGVGVLVRMTNGEAVGLGSVAFLKELDLECPLEDPDDLTLFVVADRRCVGIIKMGSVLRPEAEGFQKLLAEAGISRLALISGEDRECASGLAERIGTQEYYPDCRGPVKAEKIADLQAMQLQGEKLAYLGDGQNDMAQIHSADAGLVFQPPHLTFIRNVFTAVMYRDSLMCAVDTLKTARSVYRRQRENLLIASGIKFIFGLLALIGFLPLCVVIAAEFLGVIVQMLNAMRAFDQVAYDPRNITRAAKATGRYLEEAAQAAADRQKI